MRFFFFSFFHTLKSYAVFSSASHQRERERVKEREGEVLGEEGVVRECQGEIGEEHAPERERILIEQLSLLSLCVNAPTIMTALHVFSPVFWLKCS